MKSRKTAAILIAALVFASSAQGTDLHAKRVQGNLVYWDTYEKRFIDAVGPDVVKYVSDCVSNPTDVSSTELDVEWTNTRVEAGSGESTFSAVNAAGGADGVCEIATDNASADGVNAQLRGESFKLASTNVVYFGMRMKVDEASKDDLFIGLATTDTDIIGGIADAAGFTKLNTTTATRAFVEKSSAQTISGTLATIDTNYHIYEFYWDGTNIEFFLDGASVYKPAVTNIPTATLRLSVHFLTHETAIHKLDFDWVRVIQIGR